MKHRNQRNSIAKNPIHWQTCSKNISVALPKGVDSTQGDGEFEQPRADGVAAAGCRCR